MHLKGKILFFISILILQCAKIVAPQGGPKDVTPPKILEETPVNFTKNFDSKSIEIVFDEYIRFKNQQNAFIISPFMKKKPVLENNGESIEILIELDSLKENSTYNLNFGKNIQDNNEGNPLLNYQYVFSTGDYIDSMSISGEVRDLETKKFSKNAKVLVYKVSDTMSQIDIDSLIFKKTPDYYYVLDSIDFKINYLSPGKYFVAGLLEKDNNFLFTPGDDKIGFVDSIIDLKDSVKLNFNLWETNRYFDYFKNPQFNMFGRISFKFTGDNSKVEINRIDPKKDSVNYFEYTMGEDSIHYWFDPIGVHDSLFFEVKNEGKIIDTSKIFWREYDTAGFYLKKKITPELKFLDTIEFKYNLPIIKVDTSKIAIYENDTVPIPYSIAYNNDLLKLKILFDKKHEMKYGLKIMPKAFISQLSYFKDTIITRFKTPQLKKYGNLKYNITKHPNIDTSAIIVLQDLNKKQPPRNYYISKWKSNKSTAEFPFVSPGKYVIKWIEDKNKNKKWDTGDILEHRYPEKVFLYSDTLEIKENWNVIQDWLQNDYN